MDDLVIIYFKPTISQISACNINKRYRLREVHDGIQRRAKQLKIIFFFHKFSLSPSAM